jgi:hypothetical protein
MPSEELQATSHATVHPKTQVRSSDRKALNRAEVAALLTLDPRTVDHAIEDGTIPGRTHRSPSPIPRRAHNARTWDRLDHVVRDNERHSVAHRDRIARRSVPA